MTKQKYLPFFLILPGLVLMFSITIYPLLYSIYTSLFSMNLVRLRTPEFIGLENYLKMFKTPAYVNSWKVTFLFTVLSVAIEFSLGLFLSLMIINILQRRSIISNVFKTTFPMSMMIPPIVIGWIWRYIYNPSWGLINQVWRMLGGSEITFLSNPKIALFSVIYVDVWQWTPFFFLVLLTGLTAIPKEPVEAAKVDGATGIQLLRYLVLPMIKPFILFALLIRVMDSIKVFDTIFMMTEGGPGSVTETITLFAYRESFRKFEIGQGSAISIMILLLVIIISQIFIALMSKQQ